MIEIYSTVHRHITNRLISQKSTIETKHLKQHTLIIHTNFKTFKFSNKFKPLRSCPYKLYSISLMSPMNQWLKMIPYFTLIEIIFYHIIPQNLIFSHFSVNMIQHPLFSISPILFRIKMSIVTLLPLMITIQLNIFNRTLLLNPFLYPNQFLIFLQRSKTFLFLFHMTILMINLTLLTLKCSITLSITPFSFQKHILVLLTHLNVYSSLSPITKLHLLIFKLLIPHIIYAHFLLQTTTPRPRNLSLVSRLEILLSFVN